MADPLLRLALLVVLGGAVWLLIKLGYRFVASRRTLALAAPAVHTPQSEAKPGVRILAFSSADCRQCHQMQAPALQHVLEARKADVTVVEVDATTEHDLTRTYHVLTVPSTVILDASGKAQAVNYGFANTQRLLEQIDSVLSGVKA